MKRTQDPPRTALFVIVMVPAIVVAAVEDFTGWVRKRIRAASKREERAGRR